MRPAGFYGRSLPGYVSVHGVTVKYAHTRICLLELLDVVKKSYCNYFCNTFLFSLKKILKSWWCGICVTRFIYQGISAAQQYCDLIMFYRTFYVYWNDLFSILDIPLAILQFLTIFWWTVQPYNQHNKMYGLYWKGQLWDKHEGYSIQYILLCCY